MDKPLFIGSRRELFWDDYLIDKRRTTASPVVHKPVKKDIVITHDRPWEAGDTIYHNIIKDADIYRMYYLAWRRIEGDIKDYDPYPMVICYAQSRDGIIWEKPSLGICEFEGSRDNNIILDHTITRWDNFAVFIDSNPDCPPSEKYKGVGSAHFDDVGERNDKLTIGHGYKSQLWCFVSSDGINFKKGWMMTDTGQFDSLNIGMWDSNINKYVCYLRDFHNVPGDDMNKGIRDIRRMVSMDFKNWSLPELVDFGNGDDYPLYTNVISQYFRAEHIYTGFPTRYVERKEWSPNYDQLGGLSKRKDVMKLNPRYGLAITDCVFMTSRDGVCWDRWDEAFITPGPENDYNWVYGDCYLSLGMIQTGDEISLYNIENHMADIPCVLRRYTVRTDGFASYFAKYKPQRLVTKPFIYDGGNLFLNFSTSAIGYIKLRLLCGDRSMDSMEVFGDNTNRKVIFNGDVKEFSGKPVILEADMSDAHIYSIKFQ